MDPSPILSISQTISIGTMPNFNGGKKDTGWERLRVNRPLNSDSSPERDHVVEFLLFSW